jgi:hypothetical protein
MTNAEIVEKLARRIAADPLIMSSSSGTPREIAAVVLEGMRGNPNAPTRTMSRRALKRDPDVRQHHFQHAETPLRQLALGARTRVFRVAGYDGSRPSAETRQAGRFYRV